MFSVPTLSIGDVRILVRPVPDRATVDALVGAIRGIKGIDRVVVGLVDDDAAELVARADRPVALAGELRAVLRTRIAACTLSDDQIVLELAAPESGRRSTGRAARAVESTTPLGSASSLDAAGVEALGDLGELSILLFDREQRYTSCAGGFHKRFGQQFALMQGRRAGEVVGPAVWSRLKPGYDDALAGRPSTIDFEVPDRAGVFEAAFRPLRDGTRIIGGMVVSREVTEQRRATRMLEELSAVQRVTFDRSPVAYGLVAPDGRWVRVNRALQQLLGSDEVTLVAEHVHDRTHPADLPIHHGLLATVVGGRRDEYALTQQLRHESGLWMEVHTAVTAIRLGGGALQGFVVTLTPAVVGTTSP